MIKPEEQKILDYLIDNPNLSGQKVFDGMTAKYKADEFSMSLTTLKRRLSKKLKEANFVVTSGKGKGLKYSISPEYQFIYPIDANAYFDKKEDRQAKESFNFELIESLTDARIFTDAELKELTELQQEYKANIAGLSTQAYKKELERLSVDLTWKSSQIEGNTYSLLDTERLLKEQKTADGKTVEEATMLLNHKSAIDFLIENPDFFDKLKIRDIEDVHSILIDKLDVARNIRTDLVGVGGTKYRPLDNEHQIREALNATCKLINSRDNAFDKALLVLVLISYIQAFMDGNKRVARITANGILINNDYCPISFRTIEPADYKKAMLIFYEQNNISAFKQIFIEQFRFAVNEYFRLKNKDSYEVY
ncbi:MAG: Fic family protein [Crocinitomicaceae bacterium]|nr:Fic family protein [Crocinitomicaceae bacterium]